jgi:glycerol uptake facilitator-like aquaporin
MSSSPVTTDALEPRRSEGQFLLFTGSKEQFDSAARAIDINMLAPLLAGMVAAVLFVVLYAFLLGRLG